MDRSPRFKLLLKSFRHKYSGQFVYNKEKYTLIFDIFAAHSHREGDEGGAQPFITSTI